jgi:hypothetical protein
MRDAAADFMRLHILGAELSEVRVLPLKKLCTTFFGFGDTADGPDAGAQFDLQFNKILNFRFEFQKSRSRVTSREVYDSSEYLQTATATPIRSPHKFARDKLRHFRITFETGRLDVIAEDFTVSLFAELRSNANEPAGDLPSAH